MAFVLSARLSGLAGGVFAISHGFSSFNEVYWTTSGEVVVMTVLGGIGTLWGSVVGAALIVLLKDYLAAAGFDGIGIVTGAIFIIVVMAFRRGIWGSLAPRPRVPARSRQVRRRTGRRTQQPAFSPRRALKRQLTPSRAAGAAGEPAGPRAPGPGRTTPSRAAGSPGRAAASPC